MMQISREETEVLTHIEGTFLSLCNSVVIARLVSTAGTGFMYTTRRTRVAERLSMMKYDPKGKQDPVSTRRIITTHDTDSKQGSTVDFSTLSSLQHESTSSSKRPKDPNNTTSIVLLRLVSQFSTQAYFKEPVFTACTRYLRSKLLDYIALLSLPIWNKLSEAVEEKQIVSCQAASSTALCWCLDRRYRRRQFGNSCIVTLLRRRIRQKVGERI